MHVLLLLAVVTTTVTVESFADFFRQPLSAPKYGTYSSSLLKPSSINLNSAVTDDSAQVEPGELLSGWKGGRPLKVAIAGGGVGGLTCALAMLKRGMDVTIYERTEAFARFGGPIQFASNALSVIKAIDEDLFVRIMDR